jgi:hypothetical protein
VCEAMHSTPRTQRLFGRRVKRWLANPSRKGSASRLIPPSVRGVCRLLPKIEELARCHAARMILHGKHAFLGGRSFESSSASNPGSVSVRGWTHSRL